MNRSRWSPASALLAFVLSPLFRAMPAEASAQTSEITLGLAIPPSVLLRADEVIQQ